MKLIIQIPCLNEEDALPTTVAALPKKVKGFKTVEYLIIDDGSTDRTAEVAAELGVHHILRLGHHRGLARGFMAGIEECLRQGADVIVNTDADNQYCADDIPALTAPILSGAAAMVVGARPIRENAEFSLIKKTLQRLGSWAVRQASGTDVPDAPSGFRALSKEAAAGLFVNDTYTYTLDTLIQAGRRGMAVTWVPVRVNPSMRPSRLFGSILQYVSRSAKTIIRIFLLYRPQRFFFVISVLFMVPGLFGVLRFLYFYVTSGGSGHIQSLILSGAFLAIAVVLLVAGVLADLIAVNRGILENIRMRQILSDLKQTGPDDA